MECKIEINRILDVYFIYCLELLSCFLEYPELDFQLQLGQILNLFVLFRNLLNLNNCTSLSYLSQLLKRHDLVSVMSNMLKPRSDSVVSLFHNYFRVAFILQLSRSFYVDFMLKLRSFMMNVMIRIATKVVFYFSNLVKNTQWDEFNEVGFS